MSRIIATWSGGIDSTAVIFELLVRGHDVDAVTLLFGPIQMQKRERKARADMLKTLECVGNGQFVAFESPADMVFEAFSDGVMVPNRNKRIIDLLMARFLIPEALTELAMGEYVGADTWLVKDHVNARDADARYLEAYLLQEYGYEYRLWTLRDFGKPQRYKHERLQMLAEHIDPNLTTNCLLPLRVHCGKCYKCIERAAAFDHAAIIDTTEYCTDPRKRDAYPLYRRQMCGEDVNASWGSFGMVAP